MIFDEQDRVIENPDLTMGYLKSETLNVFHKWIVDSEEHGHYAVLATYPNGGKDIEWVVDTEEKGHWITIDSKQNVIEHYDGIIPKDLPKEKENEATWAFDRYIRYTEDELKELSNKIESESKINKLAIQMEVATLLFVRNTNLSDEQALEVSMLHEEWAPDTPYVKDDRRLYEGDLYRCIEDHVSQTTWTPMASPSLWAKILPGQSGDIGVWEQPGPTNPYRKGDRVTHNGKTWTSDIDGNIWEPGVYGWTEVDPSPEDQYPEYVVGKSYYKGDKITYGGERYECIYTEGLPCVWSPTDYPAGWKKVQ